MLSADIFIIYLTQYGAQNMLAGVAVQSKAGPIHSKMSANRYLNKSTWYDQRT